MSLKCPVGFRVRTTLSSTKQCKMASFGPWIPLLRNDGSRVRTFSKPPVSAAWLALDVVQELARC